ncbi:hypothetical protein NQ315_013776 [Exocentrus adspersus]|uniref:Dynein heavy chain linker domain-containing protein n=1 Tax=Exocentrus adspersus TaxID=1586481 RepID=A0AAV8W3Y6_9CUCU|nr:hypothetical protein NQ315_013776 [Exocentrus adspersus]
MLLDELLSVLFSQGVIPFISSSNPYRVIDLWNYIINLHNLVEHLQNNLQKCQENLNKVKDILTPFARQPLFERKESKRYTLLCIEEKDERLAKRYSDLRSAADEVSNILEENRNILLSNKEENNKWASYIDFVDEIVMSYLYQSVGCSLGYINEHMDATNNLAPLFESQLKLMEPNIVFIPSLDSTDPEGFKSIINDLINSIIDTTSVVRRFSITKDLSYKEEIEANQDIIDIKTDILLNVDLVIEEAYEFCDGFQGYSYLWLDDRTQYLEQFLKYSRPLTNEEMELVMVNDLAAPQCTPPKMEQFREQIDNFENLSNEVEKMQEEKIFHMWFKVNIKPFKQALLNTIRKWGNMFNRHLVGTVTSSLCDLSKFIRSADEGLQQTVNEGDYQALVNVMGYLLNVKERQAVTDEMFSPLKETIELLKFYDQDIPEEVNVYLQELPEQWNNTKKIAITVKQQVAPLQAAEVTFIRKRIIEFDSRISYYREVFKRYSFFRYTCPEPYKKVDMVHTDLNKFERNMNNIHESGSLFEVNVPDFKILKQCRKDLKLLKELWDFVNIVQTCVNDWKTTPWRNIDVENMDIECKKVCEGNKNA